MYPHPFGRLEGAERCTTSEWGLSVPEITFLGRWHSNLVFQYAEEAWESRPANVNLRPRSPNTVAGPSSVMNLQAKPNSDEDSHQGWEKAPPQNH